MAPRKLKPRSRKIRESFCEDLLPRKLAKETFKAQNPGFKYVCRQLPQMYLDPYGSIHYSQISNKMWPENPRKLRESSAKDPRKPWLAGMAPPDLIGEWQCPLRSGARGVWLCPLRSAVAVGVRQCPLKSGARGWGLAVPTEIWSSRLRVGWRTRRWRRRRPPDAISIQMLPQW